MQRYKLTLEYDGTPFAGWQRQAGHPSVQEALERAIEAATQEQVTTQAAGRTDAGVHALGQVAHADLPGAWDPFRLSEALNHHLKPNPVVVIAAEPVPDDFEARFSATARHYEYRILNRRARLTLDRNRVWHVSISLDAEAMHRAAQSLLGKHDFTTFRAAGCQSNSPIRTLDRLDVSREGDHVMIRVSARSFLYHQVRSFAGSLKLVGEGKWEEGGMKAALDARDRSRCGALAPACGLYLVRVDY
jgi:tRNA pseudouridine38-40 synthase